jgi:predicted nucleic-acid-binding protein
VSIERKRAIREALATLASSHAIVVQQLELAIELLNQEMEFDEEPLAIQAVHLFGSRQNSLVDSGSQSVLWKGRICFLGNTLLFRFFERISRSPNQFISYEVLLDDVWGGRRENSSFRGVAKRLRDRLALEGMAELSCAIDGSNSGFYRLMLV